MTAVAQSSEFIKLHPASSKTDAGSDVTAYLCGEWTFKASIMHCTEALNGRIAFVENGEIVYLANGIDLVGRGVGRWVTEGPAIAFELDVFQYVPTSTDHVPCEAHKFRGLGQIPREYSSWGGEWIFCPGSNPPKVVGRFDVIRKGSGPPSSDTNSDMPVEAAALAVRDLERMCAASADPIFEKRFAPYLYTGIDVVHYIPNWMEAQDMHEYLKLFNNCGGWETLESRTTQEWGSSSRCGCGRSLLREDLPPWQQNIAIALNNLGVFHTVLYPVNSIRVNSYVPGQGIHPHCDGPVYFPRVAIVSLGSACVFNFYPRVPEEEAGFKWDPKNDVPLHTEMPTGTKPSLSLILEPGSLIVFSGDAFIHHRHGINAVESDTITEEVKNAKQCGYKVGDKLPRGKRISLTIRHLLPRCDCSGF